MKDFKILKFIDKFSFIYKRLGINYDVLRKILQVKLTMDKRRSVGLFNNGNSSETNNGYTILLCVNTFMGIFIGIMLIIPLPLMISMNMIFGFILFMAVSFMIADFSNVLLDVKEKTILLSKPIDNKTFNAARITHIFIYLIGMIIALSAGSLIIGTIKFGIIFTLIFLAELVLTGFLIIFLTNVIYAILLKLFSGERLKDIINYFQILIMMLIMGGYNLSGRIFHTIDNNIIYVGKWYHFLIPSVWLSAPFSIFLNGNRDGFVISEAIFSLIFPIIILILQLKVIGPSFERNIQKLSSTDSSSLRGISFVQKLISKLICKDNVELATYRFTQNMISRERKLKLALYPSIGVGIFMPILFLFIGKKDNVDIIQRIRYGFYGKSHFIIYMTVLVIYAVASSMVNSENFKAAWIYKSLPIEEPVSILKGSLKGAFFKLQVPIYLFISIIFIAIKGFSIILDILIMFTVMCLLTILFFKIAPKQMPFSLEFSTTNNTDYVGPMMLTFMAFPFLIGIHILFRNNIIILAIYEVLLIISSITLWKKSFDLKWSDIEK